MKNQEKKLPLSSPIGYSFLLTVLVILTLVVFAVLSLSASSREYEYSRRTAEKTTAFYEANTKASRILRQIAESLAGCESLEAAWKTVGELPGVTVEKKEQAAEVSYEVEINDHQKLQILIEVTAEKDGKVSYRIREWKEAPTGSWEGDTTLPVLGSE